LFATRRLRRSFAVEQDLTKRERKAYDAAVEELKGEGCKAKYPGFSLGIIGVAAVVYICMRGASWITELPGDSGIGAVTKVMGLFVLAIGVEMIIHGIVTHGALTHLHKV
jgi:hypothetical protein